jgi:hypothetical protein
VLADVEWEAVAAIAAAVTAAVGAIAAIAKPLGRHFAKAKPSTEQPRPPTYAFPVPESAVEDVLEGRVDAVNLGGYSFTLGQDHLAVGTPTAGPGDRPTARSPCPPASDERGPRWMLQLIEGAGHMMPLTHPEPLTRVLLTGIEH